MIPMRTRDQTDRVFWEGDIIAFITIESEVIEEYILSWVSSEPSRQASALASVMASDE